MGFADYDPILRSPGKVPVLQILVVEPLLINSSVEMSTPKSYEVLRAKAVCLKPVHTRGVN